MSKLKEIYDDAKNIHNDQIISDEEQHQIERYEIELYERDLFLSELIINQSNNLTYHSR